MSTLGLQQNQALLLFQRFFIGLNLTVSTGGNALDLPFPPVDIFLDYFKGVLYMKFNQNAKFICEKDVFGSNPFFNGYIMIGRYGNYADHRIDGMNYTPISVRMHVDSLNEFKEGYVVFVGSKRSIHVNLKRSPDFNGELVGQVLLPYGKYACVFCVNRKCTPYVSDPVFVGVPYNV